MHPVHAYVPLYCKSNGSFLEGASHPEELVTTADALGLPGIAVTDRDGVYGLVRAHQRARELELPLILGAEVSIEDDAKVVLVAENRAGYANLCRLLTLGRLRGEKGESRVTWREVCELAGGLIALLGLPGGPLAADDDALDDGLIDDLQDAFGDRLHALILRHLQADDVERERRLRPRAAARGIPLVAGVEVLYHVPGRQALQDVLTCIRHGLKLPDAGRALRPNAAHALPSPAEFAERFADAPDAIARTREIASRCCFSFDDLRYRYPSERLPDGRTSDGWLRELTRRGAHKRYGAVVPGDVLDQIERELKIISALDYPGYFLTMYEIVERCRSEGILCQGRGSAANSAVCYCLGITAVDPIRMDLLFERFLSMERAEPPDIDLDIAHERREEVILWVYEKYGRDRSAMVANFIRYRTRSAIRDVGKALGIAETALDRLAKLVFRYDGDWEQMLEHAGLDPASQTTQHLIALGSEIQDFPRHLSIHPGGFLLGHEPVDTIVPIENATMEGRTVIQWDKDDLDALGLFKVDLLGLGSLALVDRCFELMRHHEGVDLALHTIPQEDPDTYDMICAADTVGVFQIESRAQMAMLPRLRPRTFYDLVIEVAIVRPGPISGDMVHPYLRRRHGVEPVTYPHPCLEPVLRKTLGVPLFQEQVMKLAVVAADYTPGEADQLRRDMAAWRRTGRIDSHRDRLIERMTQKGIQREFAERVFDQIRGFGEYGFPESHSASFALIAYATAWLKCHHPAAFLCAILNAQPMGFYSPATLVEDSKRHRVEVRPIDVTRSDWDCTLEPAENGHAVRMGLRYVSGLGEAQGLQVMETRAARAFETLADFVRRAALSERQLTTLGEAGALDGFVDSRRDALWEVWRLVRERRDRLALTRVEKTRPRFEPLDLFATIAWDYGATGHSPRGHPLGPLRPALRKLGLPDAEQVRATPDGKKVDYAGMVINRQRPGTAKGVTFMTLEDETGFVNLVIWQNIFDRYALVAKTQPFLGVSGKIQSQDGVVHVVVEKLWVPDLEAQPASGGSRDFH